MADDFNLEAKISADVSDYIRDLDRLIDKNQELSKSLQRAGVDTDKLDKQLNNARKGLTGTADATKVKERADAAAAKATRDHANAMSQQETQMSRTRYALYDVASSYAAVSAAALGAVAVTGTFAVQYETAFTEIERTTLTATGEISAGVGALREQFLDLSEVIPLTFEELTKIGSLGAQLGIAEEDLVSFTDTVAKFSALSGVTAEETALSFGRIGELLKVPASEFDNLGSAIAALAVDSAATEGQILSLVKELAAGASGAGFTAVEVASLGSALASLGVAPERARGALDTYFGTLNQAVAEGGEELEKFAIVTGLTTDQINNLVRTGGGREVFDAFISGLADLDNVAKTTALDDLGLSQLRVENTLRRLANSQEFVNEQFELGASAAERSTFLNDAFAVKLDDVASQFQLLLNTVGRFLATAGQPMLEFLRLSLPLLAQGVSGLTDFASSAGGQQFFGFLGFLTAAIGLLAGFRAITALSTGAVFALVTASRAIGGTGVVASLRAMLGAMAGIGPAAAASAGGVSLLAGAIRGLLRSTIILGLVATALDLILYQGQETKATIDFLADGVSYLSDVTINMSNNWQTAWAANAQSVRNMFPILGGLIDVLNTVYNFAGRVAENFRIGQQAALGLSNSAGFDNKPSNGRQSRGKPGVSLRDPRPPKPPKFEMPNFDEAIAGAQDYGNALGGGGGGRPSVAEGAREAQKEVRTLEDYASDLATVFSRSFDLRFASQLSMDAVADSWDTLTDRINAARMSLQGLTADRNIKQYFLSVADAYGDELRAGVLRAEIAEINEKIADTQAEASTELNGNSKAARNNRKALTDLSKGYDKYITDLASSGADQATLNRAVDQSEREFIAQATALGFSRAQLEPYIQRFRDLTTVINTVPRNITVSANTDPATQALNEFLARARSATANVSIGAGGGDGYSAGLAAGQAYGNGWVQGTSQYRRLYTQQDNSVPGGKTYQYFGPGGAISPKFFAEGGYTGRGGKYEPAGIVHKGEYVVPKHQVNQSTGLPYANALGGAKPASRPAGGGYSGGGMVGGAGIVGVMELGPKSLSAVQSIARQQVIAVLASSDAELARRVGNGSKQLSARGNR